MPRSTATAPKVYTERPADGWRIVVEVNELGSVCRVSINGMVARYERLGTHRRVDYAVLFDDSGRRFKTLAAAMRALG